MIGRSRDLTNKQATQHVNYCGNLNGVFCWCYDVCHGLTWGQAGSREPINCVIYSHPDNLDTPDNCQVSGGRLDGRPHPLLPLSLRHRGPLPNLSPTLPLHHRHPPLAHNAGDWLLLQVWSDYAVKIVVPLKETAFLTAFCHIAHWNHIYQGRVEEAKEALLKLRGPECHLKMQLRVGFHHHGNDYFYLNWFNFPCTSESIFSRS